MDKQEKKIALFIDCENISAKWADRIFESLLNVGDICVKKAYGDWRSRNLKLWDTALSAYAIEPVHIITGNHNKSNMAGGKNSCDIKLSIDVMNCLYDGIVDCIVLASSDSDFAPLAQEIRKRGIQVIGFGETKARDEYQRCFVSFEVLDKRRYEGSLHENKMLVRKLRKAIDSVRDNISGRALLATVGCWMRNNYSQNAQSYGKATWGEVFKELEDEFRIITEDGRKFVEYSSW